MSSIKGYIERFSPLRQGSYGRFETAAAEHHARTKMICVLDSLASAAATLIKREVDIPTELVSVRVSEIDATNVAIAGATKWADRLEYLQRDRRWIEELMRRLALPDPDDTEGCVNLPDAFEGINHETRLVNRADELRVLLESPEVEVCLLTRNHMFHAMIIDGYLCSMSEVHNFGEGTILCPIDQLQTWLSKNMHAGQKNEELFNVILLSTKPIVTKSGWLEGLKKWLKS